MLYSELVDSGFRFALLAFAVTLGWGVASLAREFPALHRIGRIWSSPRDLLVVAGGWALLVLLIISSYASIALAFQSLRDLGISQDTRAREVDFVIIGLVAASYIPAALLINRAVAFAAAFLSPQYVRDLFKDSEQLALARGRLSDDTRRTLEGKRGWLVGLAVAGDSLGGFAIIACLTPKAVDLGVANHSMALLGALAGIALLGLLIQLPLVEILGDSATRRHRYSPSTDGAGGL